MEPTGAYGRRGILVRCAYLLVALAWWVLSGFGRWGRGSAVVLCYHAIRPDRRSRFRRQMERIRSRAIDSAKLSSIPPRRAGRLPLVCVTFDDGFACLRDGAFPVLRELGIPATVFAVTGNAGRPPGWDMPPGHPESGLSLMTEEEMEEARTGSPVRFGSHTVTHPRLTDLAPPDLDRELLESRAALGRILGPAVEDIAFPFGAYDDRVAAAALSAGYTRLYTLDPCCHPGPLPSGRVGRFSMTPDAWPIEFLLTAAGAYAWLHPWRRLLRKMRGSDRRIPARGSGATTTLGAR